MWQKIGYIKSSNGVVYLTHTEVPPDLKRRRIGYRLVEKVLANVGRQSRRLVSLCTFVVMCIQKYPGWKRLLPEGFRVN